MTRRERSCQLHQLISQDISSHLFLHFLFSPSCLMVSNQEDDLSFLRWWFLLYPPPTSSFLFETRTFFLCLIDRSSVFLWLLFSSQSWRREKESLTSFIPHFNLNMGSISFEFTFGFPVSLSLSPHVTYPFSPVSFNFVCVFHFRNCIWVLVPASSLCCPDYFSIILWIVYAIKKHKDSALKCLEENTGEEETVIQSGETKRKTEHEKQTEKRRQRDSEGGWKSCRREKGWRIEQPEDANALCMIIMMAVFLLWTPSICKEQVETKGREKENVHKNSMHSFQEDVLRKNAEK